MFHNREKAADEDHKLLYLCVPGATPGPSAMRHYDSASPFFNCPVDYSLGIDSSYGQISVDINFSNNSNNICECRGNMICHCLPVEPSTSSFKIGPFHLSSIKKRNIRNNDRGNSKLAVLRGVVKTPRFYRTTKIRNINETFLFYSSSRFYQPHFRSSFSHGQHSNKERDSKFRSKIPIPSAITTMLNFNLEENKMNANSLKKAIEEFNTLNFGSQLKELGSIPEETNVLTLTESFSSTAITNGSQDQDCVDDLCSRIHNLPLQEQSGIIDDLCATVNSLLPKIESFSVSSEDQLSV